MEVCLCVSTLATRHFKHTWIFTNACQGNVA